MEGRVVKPNIAPSMILIKVDIYKLHQTLGYKQNKNFINGIQQIRRGSSWYPNQRNLVANDKRQHYKTIENIP